MLETLIHYHNLPDQSYSPDEFQSWKDNPVTKQLFKDLSLISLQGLLSDLPDNPNEGTADMYRRDGAIGLMSIILDRLEDKEAKDDS